MPTQSVPTQWLQRVYLGESGAYTMRRSRHMLRSTNSGSADPPPAPIAQLDRAVPS